MKTLLLIASLLVGAVSSAQVTLVNPTKGVLNFKVVNATYSKAHVFNAGEGSVTVDFDKSLVTLNVVEIHQPCPKGMMCTMDIRAPLHVELPVVSVKADSCGVKTIVARQDMRPVDGALEQITVTDPSHMTCQTLVAVVPQATYTTQYFDRRNGKNVTDESDMNLDYVMHLDSNQVLETSLAPSILIKSVQNAGFSPDPSTKTLYVDITGRVILNVKSYRTNQVTVANLAQLSNEALQNLTAKVNALSLDLKLVDLSEGQPMCMDAPSTEVIATVQNRDLTIHRQAGCHVFTTQDYSAEELSDLLSGFEALVK